jgi:hypothetical protein
MPRRVPRWQDAVGTSVAGLWPVAITLAVLRNPARYNPVALYSGLGTISFHHLSAAPTTDPNIYATAYALGVRAASLLAHGHLGWWNPYEGLGSPLIGEAQSGGLFPFTLLLLLHDGSLIFHLALESIAAIATYWLLREFRCGPIVSAAGGMLFATNGTFAIIGNAAFNPVCFIPLLLLGIERARRATLDDKGGGWRWLAVGGALLLLAGFVETAALTLIFAVALAVQRGFTLPRDRLVPYVRKVVAGLAVGIGVAAPLLVAFQDFLSSGYVAEHAGNTAQGALGGPYVFMLVTPFLDGQIFQSKIPYAHAMWGAVGGFAGFALLALGVAGLFGRRERGLRMLLGAWVGLSLADTMGVTPFRQLFGSIPVIDHVVLYRNLPPTWEFALVFLGALALRDCATSSRAQSAVALATGLLASLLVLLIGVSIAPIPVAYARVFTSGIFEASVLLVVVAVGGFLLSVALPSRFRAAGIGLVAVCESAVLFAVPLLSWPAPQAIDGRVTHFLTSQTGDARFAGLGVPTPNLGSILSVREFDEVDLPVATQYVAATKKIDPFEKPTVFSGSHPPKPGEPTSFALMSHDVGLYENEGVRFIITRSGSNPFVRVHGVRLAFHDPRFWIWRLPDPRPYARAPGCAVSTGSAGDFVVSCSHTATLFVDQLYFPGWTASINGAGATVKDQSGFQAVDVPKGRSVVALNYLPPGVPLAAVGAGVALLGLLVPWELIASRRRRRLALSASAAVTKERFLRLGRTRDDASADRVPDPPTGALLLSDLEPMDQGEPTTAAPLVVGAGAPDRADDEPAVAAVATLVEDRPDDRPDDPPTISVEVPPR